MPTTKAGLTCHACRIASAAILFITGLLGNASDARANSIQTFILDNISWHVPAMFFVAKQTQNRIIQTFSVRYELPDFNGVNMADFKGVYPEDDRPILTVQVSNDQNIDDPGTSLRKYIAEAEKDCPHCTNTPSSVGGMEYATFDGISPSPYSPDGVLFHLYEYPDSNGQYSICHFNIDLAPLECEMAQKIGNHLLVTIDFPIEYVTEGPDLMSHTLTLLANYQSPKPPEPTNTGKTNIKPICWHPPAGSEGAVARPLRIGPETWHIPKAYAITFGLNQTSDPKYDSISFWLKLPDLEPLTSSDPSPITIRGPGNYIFITMGYDGRSGIDIRKTESLSKWIKFNNYIGKNAFVNYFEYQNLSEKSKFALSFLYHGKIDFLSNHTPLSLVHFPPDWFQCSQFGGAPDPLCTFRLSEAITSNGTADYNSGHYDLEYFFSRDYFSKIYTISSCMQNLYETFRYDNPS